jgi:hypothetical protein
MRLTSVARRAGSRAAWRVACQRRTTRFATLARMMKRLVPGERTARTKVPGAWRVEVERPSGPLVVMSIVTRARCRSVADFAKPIVVHVHEPELVDVFLLERLEMQGMVRVAISPLVSP